MKRNTPGAVKRYIAAFLVIVAMVLNGYSTYRNIQTTREAEIAGEISTQATIYLLTKSQEVQQYYDKLKSLNKCTEV